MSFIRVRAVDGPAHEFDAPTIEVEKRPELYVVIDTEPVGTPRPTKYVTSEPTPKAAPKRTASTPTARAKRASSKKE